MKYAISAAAGNLGRLTLEGLLLRVPSADIIAIVRRPENAMILAPLGVDVRLADYAHPEALEAALTGVDILLLISGTEIGERARQHANVIDAAVAQGVSRVLYTSAPAADTTALVVAPDHKETESYLRASGLAWTILRNGWYTENFLHKLGEAKMTGGIMIGAPTGKVSSASRRDFADAAVVAMTEPGHEGRTYELFGDHAWAYAELADVLTRMLDKEIHMRILSPADLEQQLLAVGMPAAGASALAALEQNIEDGLLGIENGELARLIGRNTTPLHEGFAAALTRR